MTDFRLVADPNDTDSLIPSLEPADISTDGVSFAADAIAADAIAAGPAAAAPGFACPPAGVTVRSARPEDARLVGRLFRIAADGMADYTWSTLAGPGEDLLDVAERRFAREGVEMSCENALFAEIDGEVLGMLHGFPVPDGPAPVADPGADPVLAPVMELEQPGSFYIAALAVFDLFRGYGVGSKLLGMAEALARSHGTDTLSLIVFEQNHRALRLYRRHGYREVARRPLTPHPLLRFGGDALLVTKTLG